MKQDYLNNLSQEFDNKDISTETYSQIVDKYSSWYDRLLSDGKNDKEIHEILKSPKSVADIFAEKFGVTPVVASVEEEIVSEIVSEISTETIVPDQDFTEQKSSQDVASQPVNYNAPDYTPNYIVKTNKRGKQKFYEKRSFLGGLGIFLLFVLVSAVCLPVLFGLFSVTLTLSFAFMLLFFTPFYYLCFIWRFDSVSYLEHVSTGRVITDNVLVLPIDKINDVLEYLNQITSFQFPVFMQAVLISIFGFAGLLLSLYLCLNMFRANVGYFSWFFNKMSLRRVK